MKLAVLFPGIGYTCDKPLLYYASKIAAAYGYEVISVRYGNFPSGVKGDRQKMEDSFKIALEQTEEILKHIDWNEYEDILFISKSVGTIVAACYRKMHGIQARSISFTPLKDTFRFAQGEGIMFHGTADPWVENSQDIIDGCEKIHQPLHLIAGSNHSLELGNVSKDLENMKEIMKLVEKYIIACQEC